VTGPERPRRRGIWITIAAMTAFVAVVPVGVQVWGRLIRQTESTRVVYGHAIIALEVDAGSGSVTVGAGPASQVTVDRTLKWTLSKPHVEQSWNGGTLRLKAVCGTRRDLFSSLECGIDLHVRVPAGVTLQAASTSGTIAAQGLTGGLRLQTKSGAVSMSGVRGPIWARSTAGVISGTELASQQVDAGSSSGAVGLSFADAPQRVNASADSGSVSIVLPPGFRYRVGGTSASGARNIDAALIDGSANRRIDVSTASGSATVRFPAS
jgi:hypothetical protein